MRSRPGCPHVLGAAQSPCWSCPRKGPGGEKPAKSTAQLKRGQDEMAECLPKR